MNTARKSTVVPAVVISCILLVNPSSHADIYTWDLPIRLIPGTEGIEPGPGVQLDHMELEYARLCPTKSTETLDLANANFEMSNLSYACFQSTNLTDANFAWANLTTTIFGTMGESSNLTNANFAGANLNDTALDDSILTGIRLAGANVANTRRISRKNLRSATYSQWTVFPDSFDPVAKGLTLLTPAVGDFDADGDPTASDVNALAGKIREPQRWGWLDEMFDLNSDTVIDREDHRIWIKDLKYTWYGDANLDGEFNSHDFVEVFLTGEYESDEYASWCRGDWNGDGFFDSSDMVTAFVDGGYEQGPRTNAVTVPEPDAAMLMLMVACLFCICVHGGRGRRLSLMRIALGGDDLSGDLAAASTDGIKPANFTRPASSLDS